MSPRANYVIPPKGGKVYILSNEDIERLLPIGACMDGIEEGYREWEYGNAAIRPKKSVHIYNPEEDSRYSLVSFDGGIQKLGVYALRMRSDLARGVGYRPEETRDDFVAEGERKYCGLVLYFSSKTGLPLAIMPDGFLQHARVASLAGIAAKYLARRDARTLGILGSQWMARLHAQTLCAVRPIRHIKVYSPNRNNREAFAREMAAKLSLEVEAKANPEEVVRGSDMVACCTDSTRTPVFGGKWLEPGAYLCNVLSGEVPEDAYQRLDYMVMNQPLVFNETLGLAGSGETPVAVAGQPPAGAVMPGTGGLGWERHVTPETPLLSQVITGRAKGRTDDKQIILFNNNEGTGIQFAAAGAVILSRLDREEARRVNSAPLDWFLQDIPD